MHNPNWKKRLIPLKLFVQEYVTAQERIQNYFCKGVWQLQQHCSSLSSCGFVLHIFSFFLISQMPWPRAWPHYQSLVSCCHHQGIPVNSFSSIPDLTDNMTQPSLTGCLCVKPGAHICTALSLNARVIPSSIITVAGIPCSKRAVTPFTPH